MGSFSSYCSTFFIDGYINPGRKGISKRDLIDFGEATLVLLIAVIMLFLWGRHLKKDENNLN